MSIQNYVIHLIDGSTITVAEDYDLPFEDGLANRFALADVDCVLGFDTVYIPKRNILYIEAGDVDVK